jgi:hypothetical protein
MDSLLLRRVQTGLLVRQGIIEPVMPRRSLICSDTTLQAD